MTDIAKFMEEAGVKKGDSLEVNRYDRVTLGKPEQTQEGFLKADALLTRAGLFTYPTPHGNLIELRPTAAVFDAVSLESLKMKPVTDDHPVVGGRKVMLTTDNIAQFSKGHIGEVLERVGDNIRAKVLITDAATVKAVLAGRNQISCGYVCKLNFDGGEFEGKRYDAVQSNIVYNHVAVVREGRAGPDVAMRIDSAEGIVLNLDNLEQQEGEDGHAPVDKVTRIHLLKPAIL